LESTIANPSEVLEFQIKIISNATLNSVTLIDTLPDRITIRQDSIKIDGIQVNGNLISGINIGNFDRGQTKTITFIADISPKDKFSFGSTSLINTATVYWNGGQNSDSATIFVNNAAVAGAATAVSTGFSDSLVKYLPLPFILVSTFIWLLKAHIIRWEEWIGENMLLFKNFKSNLFLKIKILKIKLKEL
jgi:uncharacterized repeat protein (TIGR01451 family)